ncbi:hypothetical protein ACHAXR_007249 [Thalassiosira sp. AJA248-18]
MTDSVADSKEPVAGLSAASSCISITLSPSASLPSSSSSPPDSSWDQLPPFRPVYTHQSFEKECITGWRPFPEAEHQSQQIHRSWKGSGGDGNDEELHPSYQNCRHDQPTKEGRMDIRVILSPSCEDCRIEIQTEQYVPTNNDGKEPAPKRVKMVSFGGVEHIDNQDDTTQMHIADVVKKMALAVPPIVSVKVNGTSRNEWAPAKEDGKTEDGKAMPANNKNVRSLGAGGYLTQPVGQVLKTYHRKIKGGRRTDSSEIESKFVITMADGSDPQVARYHNAIQPLARWFIETADDVDVSDSSRGSWKVMYLFRHHDGSPPNSQTAPSTTLSLVGYITLLHVHSPFRKPRAGIIVRVCQALLLPPYHRAGHGSTMLHSLFGCADTQSLQTTGMDILEVNVEDPAPAFVALRDSVDYHRFLMGKLNLDYLNHGGVTNKDYFLPVSDNKLSSVAEALKITKRQAQIVHEMYKLAKIEEWKQSLANNDANMDVELIRQVETNYRLMVKKSLRTFRMEELGAFGGEKEKQKALLGQWFEETSSHYHRLLGHKS